MRQNYFCQFPTIFIFLVVSSIFTTKLLCASILSMQPIVAATEISSSGPAMTGYGAALVLEEPTKRFRYGWKTWLSYQPSQYTTSSTNDITLVNKDEKIERNVMAVGASAKFSFSDQLYLAVGGGIKQFRFEHETELSNGDSRLTKAAATFTSVGLNTSLETDIVFGGDVYLGIEWIGIYTPVYNDLSKMKFESTAQYLPEDIEKLQKRYEEVAYTTHVVLLSPRVGYVF